MKRAAGPHLMEGRHMSVSRRFPESFTSASSGRAVAVPLFLLLAAGLPPAAAQDGGAQSVLEEIVVTARHREERLQDLSISATAIDGATLERSGVARARDLEYMVPNLVFGNTGTDGETFVGIRGVGDFSRNIGFDTRVGVYVDGVFVGQSLAINQALVDVDRIEVLRGPQGTLFGKNTSSGVISINTRRPEHEFGGFVNFEYGNYDNVGGSGAVNLPLGDSLAARGSFVVKQRDGYVKNLFNGKDLLSEDYWGARGQLLFTPADRLEVRLSGDWYQSRPNILFLEPTAEVPGVTFGGFAAAPKRLQVSQDVDLKDRLENGGVSLSIEYETAGGFTLTSITGYRFSDRVTNSDEDASPLDGLYVDGFHDDLHHVTQEFRLASPRHERFDYVLGAFYFHQRAESLRSAMGGVVFGGPFLAAHSETEVDVDAWALFGNGNFHLNERFSINAGLRLNQEDREVQFDQAATPFFPPILLREGESEFNVTATASLNYRFSDDVRGYFTWGRGTKAGGWNVDFVSVADIRFADETVDTFEVGVKAELFGRRLRVNGAVFHSEFSNFQVFQFQATDLGTNLILTNAGEVTATGVELEVAAVPMEGLLLTGGLGYADTTFERFRDGGGIGIDFDGNTLPRAPEVTASASIQYTHPAGAWGDLVWRGEYSYRDDQYFNPDNLPNTLGAGYSLFNARVGLVGAGDSWEIFVWGRNLTDERYVTNRGVSFLGIPFDLYGTPRTYGVSIRKNF
jgi:iron complex outermembrane receptor protein